MINNNEKHIIAISSSINFALSRLELLSKDAILFVVDSERKLVGSLTDGDIRRGLIKGISIDESVTEIVQSDPKFILKSNFDIKELIKLRDKNYKIFPVIGEEGEIITIVNFRLTRSYIPVDAVIMAGGRGSRLKPLTNDTPKPLLPVGEKRIMEHNVDRLALFGIDNFWFSVNYLGEKIKSFFGTGEEKNINISYVWEDKPLGTIGAISKINDFQHEDILVTNSDILTNLNYEKFYLDFINSNADLSIVSIPYVVNIPYAVLERDVDGYVKSFKEKPKYTYYSNGGIYLVKKSALELIPKDLLFDATDLIEKLISLNKKVTTYSFHGYWLDVGKHDDYKKAEEDINKINFD